MSALSTSSCDSSLCETPLSMEPTSPHPGHSRGVSFSSQCIIIPESEEKIKRKLSIPSLTRSTSNSSTHSSGLKSLFNPKMRRRASDQGVAPLRSCLARSNSASGSTSNPSTPIRPVHTNRRASSSAIPSLQTQPLSPCCPSCIPSYEKGLSPDWEIRFSGGARIRLGPSACENDLASNVKVVDEVECKRAAGLGLEMDLESPVDSPCPKWRNRLCPLSRSSGAGMPVSEGGCSRTLEEEQAGDDKCEALKKACTGIWITSRPSASPSPSRTSSSINLPSLLPSSSTSGSGQSTPTRPTLVIRTSSSQSLEKQREGCMAAHSDRVLQRESATPSPPASIKGLLAKEAQSVNVETRRTRPSPPSSWSTGKKEKSSSRWLGFGIGV